MPIKLSQTLMEEPITPMLPKVPLLQLLGVAVQAVLLLILLLWSTLKALRGLLSPPIPLQTQAPLRQRKRLQLKGRQPSRLPQLLRTQHPLARLRTLVSNEQQQRKNLQ